MKAPTTDANIANASLSPPAPTEITPGAAASPDFSTASTAGTLSAPSESATDAIAPSTGGTYMPGSTGTATGYPTGDTPPTTSGSYFR